MSNPQAEWSALNDNDESFRQDLTIVAVSSFVFGFTSGAITGSRLAGRQFLAENAHRLPKTVQGWYFYQKTKNYRVMWGGISKGLRTGAQLAAWAGSYRAMAEFLDRGARRTFSIDPNTRTRWGSGALAGLTLASASKWFYKLPSANLHRYIFIGVSLGAISGAAQDLRATFPKDRQVLEE